MNHLKLSFSIVLKQYRCLHLQYCQTPSNSSILSSTFNKNHYKHEVIRIHFAELRKMRPLMCKLFCTIDDKNQRKFDSKREMVVNEFKNYLQTNKEKFHVTEKRLMQKAHIIVDDVRKKKNIVKESMGNIIERENVYTIPNLLCVLRIGLSPYLGLLIIDSQFPFALALLGFAAFTDLLDGWIARTWESQSSKMGSFLDPMADKVLIATLFLSLTYADLIPVILTSVIIGRDILLIIAGFVIRYQSLPPPRTFSRYFDVTHATAQLAPTFTSKINTAVQLLLVGSTLAAPVFHYVGHPALECLWYITGASTIAAALSYIVSKNTYKYLRDVKNKKQ